MSNMFSRLPRLARLLPILAVLIVALALMASVTSASGAFSTTTAANHYPNGAEWYVSGNVGLSQRAYLETLVAFCGSGRDYYSEFSSDYHVDAGYAYKDGHINDVTFYLWSYTQGQGLNLEASQTIYLGCP